MTKISQEKVLFLILVAILTAYAGTKPPPGPHPGDPMPPAWITNLHYDPSTGNLIPTPPIKLIFLKHD